MDNGTRFLLGYGERLTEPVLLPPHGGPKAMPYAFDEQQLRLAPMLTAVAHAVDELPQLACPRDFAVVSLTLHPAFVAKSYFPSALLNHYGFRPVGSKSRLISPTKRTKIKHKEELSETTELFIAGSRSAFRSFAEALPTLSAADGAADDIRKIESVHVPLAHERLRVADATGSDLILEAVLHAQPTWGVILRGFDAYLEHIGIAIDKNRQRFVDGLCFVPVRASRDSVEQLALFSFLRIARSMPRIRELNPTYSFAPGTAAPTVCTLPNEKALDAGIRVAVFDGGLVTGHPISAWASSKISPRLGPPISNLEAHGLAVTSALLFGSLPSGSPIERPMSNVDHYRVLDDKSFDAAGEYVDVLDRIVDVLDNNQYDFVNLSIGPRFPIEDDDVNQWTARLDKLAANGRTLILCAVGNDGQADRLAGLARVQPPSDGVNIVGVGAASSETDTWRRAPYSCIGPGRRPGMVKPDALSFGGDITEPYWVLDAAGGNMTRAVVGTSFASPNLLRVGVGVRAVLGKVINPLGIRALLIHHADAAQYPIEEVGHGRVPGSVDQLITCAPGIAHVLYQGTLEPGKYLRARIPMPADNITGFIRLRATCCYATDIDPKDPTNYTRAGIEIIFRPNKARFAPISGQASKARERGRQARSKTFFSDPGYATEFERRVDFGKWETVLRGDDRFRSTTLDEPIFDIHYNARQGGAQDQSASKIPFALVLSIEVESMPDLYDRIATRYRTVLEPLRPVIEIPLRVTG